MLDQAKAILRTKFGMELVDLQVKSKAALVAEVASQPGPSQKKGNKKKKKKGEAEEDEDSGPEVVGQKAKRQLLVLPSSPISTFLTRGLFFTATATWMLRSTLDAALLRKAYEPSSERAISHAAGALEDKQDWERPSGALIELRLADDVDIMGFLHLCLCLILASAGKQIRDRECPLL